MTRFLFLGENAVLGRVHAVNRKHRLRSKHFREIEDWPESGARIDVIDAEALGELDQYPNRDDVLVVSEKLLGVMKSLADVQSFPLMAGEKTVHLVLPMTSADVMYTAESKTYSRNGYSVTKAQALRVEDEPSEVFCKVRNTGLVAVSNELAAAAEVAGVRWTLHEVLDHYEPFRPHPYFVYRTGNACARAEEAEATTPWPDAPTSVPHPLGSSARDAALRGDPHERWTKLVHNTSSTIRCAFARYCSGLELPSFSAKLDADFAKSKLKKRWKETLAAGALSMGGLPAVSGPVRDRLLAAGVEASFDAVPLHDDTLEASTEFFLMTPHHVMEWIDWSKSDVGLRMSGFHEDFFDLEPTEDSYGATLPLVRVANSNLILVHESIVGELSDEVGFRMTPLHECLIARGLDDRVRAT